MKKTTVMAFLLALLAPIMSAWAGSSGPTTYNYSASVSVTASGHGKVYVDKTNPPSDKTKNYDTNSISETEEENKEFYFYAFAEPDPGYEFVRWTGGGDTPTEPTTKVTISLNKDKQIGDLKLEATFKERTDLSYAVTFLPTAHGTYKAIDVNNVDWMGQTTPIQNKPLEIKLSATPDDNFRVAGFYTTKDGKNKTYLTTDTVTLVEDMSVGVDFMPNGAAIYAVKAAKTYEDLTTALKEATSGESISVYESVDLNGNAVLPVGVTLSLETGVTITVNDTLAVAGTVVGAGTIAGSGCLYKISQLIDQGEVVTPKRANDSACGKINIGTHLTMTRYCDTRVSVNNPIIEPTVTCSSIFWGVLLNGEKAYKIKNQNPIAVKVEVDSTSDAEYNTLRFAVNKIKSVIAESDIAAGGKIVDEVAYVLLADCSIKGIKNVQNNNTRSQFCGMVDCAHKTVTWDASDYSNKIAGSNSVFLNGSIKIIPSSENQNSSAAFFNCQSISISSIKGKPVYCFYDCGLNGAPASVSFSYYSDGLSSSNYRTAHYYSGCYDNTFKEDDDKKIGKSHVYGGAYLHNPAEFDCVESKIDDDILIVKEPDNSSEYYRVEVKSNEVVVPVAAIEGDSTPYTTLTSAFDYAKDGCVIKLLTAVDLGNEVLTVPDRLSMTLVLAGKSISNGKIINKGGLIISDDITGPCSSVDQIGEGSVGIDIENNGTLDLIFGRYSGAIVNNSGTLTTHNGLFSGTLTKNGGTVKLKGGHFSRTKFTENGLYDLGVADKCEVVVAVESGTAVNWYTVCEPPDGTLRSATINSVGGYRVTPYSQSNPDDYTLILNCIKNNQNAYSMYANRLADWMRLAELLSFYQAYNNKILDSTLLADREIAPSTIKVTGSLNSLTYPITPAETIVAGSTNRYLSAKMVASGQATYGITFGQTFTHQLGPFTTIGFALETTSNDKNKSNNGTVCDVWIELWDSTRASDYDATGHMVTNTRYIVGHKLIAIGAGSNLAMIRPATGAATFYATPQDAFGKVADLGTVMLANDCTEGLELNKTGTYTFDTMGFAFAGAVSVANGLFVKSSTSVDSSAKVLVADAKATTYVVAQKVAGVGGQFYDNLADAVKAAGESDVIKLYATTTEEIKLTAEGQSITLDKNGVEFDDKQIKTDVENASVVKVVNGDNTVYTVVIRIVDDGNGNKYVSVSDAVDNISGDEISVTVTAEMSETEKVTLPQGKALIVTGSTGVTPKVDVVASTGAFVVETEVEGGKRYESKKITVEMKEPTAAAVAVTKIDNGTESEVTGAAEINAAVTKMMGNNDVSRTDNTDKLDVLDKITVTPTKIVEEVVDSKTVIRSATFDVTPSKDGTTVTKPAKPVKFRLPVDSEATQLSAIVYHGDAQFGIFAVQTYNNEKFVEVESDTFSPYGYELLDGETANPVAAIGTTGYATLPDAIAAASNGDTITVFAGTFDIGSDTIVVNKELTITGAGKDVTVLNSSVSGKSAFSIAADNVTIEDLTISLSNTADMTRAISVGNKPQANVVPNTTLQGLKFSGGRNALSVYAFNLTIDSCDFSEQYRDAILLYTVQGNSAITDNTFVQTTPGGQGFIYGTTSDGTDPLSSGTLTISGNTATGGRCLYHCNNQDRFDTTTKMTLDIVGNLATDYNNKGIVFASHESTPLGSIFNSITITNNTLFTSANRPAIQRDDTDASSLAIDASGNYWGSATPDFDSPISSGKYLIMPHTDSNNIVVNSYGTTYTPNSSSPGATVDNLLYKVTFVDEDGTTILYETNLASGNTPVYGGTTPTKAATAQYTFTWVGWTYGGNTYGTADTLAPVADAAQTYTATYSSVVNDCTVTVTIPANSTITVKQNGAAISPDTGTDNEFTVPYGTELTVEYAATGAYIAGGTQSQVVTADSTKTVAAPNDYSVVPAVAQIGSTYYPTLAAAIAAANATAGSDTVTIMILQASVTMGDSTITHNVFIDTELAGGATINFNESSFTARGGAVVTFADDVAALGNVVLVVDGGSPAVSDAKLVLSNNVQALYMMPNVSGGEICIEPSARVSINNHYPIYFATGKVTVNGNLAAGKGLTATSAEIAGAQQLTGGYMFLYFGNNTVELNDTYATSLYVDPYTAYWISAYGSSVAFNLNNSTLYLGNPLGENGGKGFNMGGLGTMTMVGSRLIANGTVTLNSGDVVNMSGKSAITAAAFGNSGVINVDVSTIEETDLPFTIITVTGGGTVTQGAINLTNIPDDKGYVVSVDGNKIALEKAVASITSGEPVVTNYFTTLVYAVAAAEAQTPEPTIRVYDTSAAVPEGWHLVTEGGITTLVRTTFYNVWVGGTQITSANATDVFGDGKVSYDAATKTLTLNGYTYSGTGYGDSAVYIGDMGGATFNIVVAGENSLTSTAAYGYAIRSVGTGAVTVTGSGSDPSLVLTVPSAYDTGYAVSVKGTSATFKDLSMAVTGYLGLVVNGNNAAGDALTIDNCDVVFDGTAIDQAIWVYNTLGDGTVSIENGSSLTGKGAILVFGYGTSAGDANLSIVDSTVNLTGATTASASSASKHAIEVLSNVGDSVLTIDNSTVTVTASNGLNPNGNGPDGINVGSQKSANDKGFAKIDIKNDSVVTATGNANGVNLFTWGSATAVNPCGAELSVVDSILNASATHATGGHYGIVAYAYQKGDTSVVFENSTVNASAPASAGIYIGAGEKFNANVGNLSYAAIDSDVTTSGPYGLVVSTISADGSNTSAMQTVDISGGSFTCNGLLFVYGDDGENTASVSMSGVTAQIGTTTATEESVLGTVTTGELSIDSGDYTILHAADLDAFDVADGDISGGNFNEPVPEELCADTYIPAPQDPVTGKYTVKQGAYVTQIVGGEKYETLADAFANAANGDTVTLLDNVTLTEPLNVTLGNKAVVLDLGGKTLAGRTNLKSGSLTIQNGTVAGGSQQALNVYGSADTAATNYSVLTIASDVTVTADVYGVCMFGETAGSNGYGAVVNIAGTVTTTGDGQNGAVFVSGNLGKYVSGDAHNVINVTGTITSATDAAIAMNGLATVNVSAGATVTGNTAIAVKRGTLNVTGGTIRATGEKHYDAAAYANGTEMTGAAISVSDTYSQYGAMTVNVSGGTVESDNADALFKKDGDYKADATIAVSAGSFSSAVAEEFCAAGYIPGEKNPDTGLYTVVTGKYVAQIVRGGSVVKKYTTLAGAIAASETDDTVQLLANVTENVSVNKAITIDGQTYTLTGDGNSTVLTVDGGVTVTVENIVIDGAALFNYLDGTVKVTGYSTLALGEGVSIKNGIYCNLYLDRGSVTGSQGVTMVGGEAVVNAEGKAMYGEEDITVAVQALSSMLNGGSSLEPGTTIGLPYFDIVRQRPDDDIVNIADGEGRVKQGASLLFLANGDFSADGQETVTLPTRFYSYTLNIANFVGATGWTEGEWNDIIDTGCDTIDLIAGTGQGETPLSETVDVTLKLNEDVVIPGENGFEYRNSNFTIDGNGNAISGTIVYTDTAGTMENVIMGTKQAPLVLDMTGLGEGNSINLGSGIAAKNVTIKVTETQAATQGTTIVTWNAGEDGEEEAASLAAGVTVAIVDATTGEPVKDEQGEDKTASLMWDAELGIGYIGPCEARLTTVDANSETVYIYTSLAHAIELARNSGDTVTLMMDIENFTGTQDIDKSLVLDGAGHTIKADASASSIGAMFDVRGEEVVIKNMTIDGDHKYWYCVQALNGACTLQDMTILNGAQRMGDEENPQVGYGSAVHVNGADLRVSGEFNAIGGGKTAGVFPFTAILYSNGTVYFADGAEADIGKDLLLVGMGPLNIDEFMSMYDIEEKLAEMNIPGAYIPYTLALDGTNSGMGFVGASPQPWNTIIDYGKEIMEVATEIGFGGFDMEPDTTPVEVGLLTDTELPDTFTYEDSNFTVNGNDHGISGTIVYTDTAGTMENVVMGTKEKPLVLDMTKLSEGNSINLGSGIAAKNVTIKVTEEQAALMGQTIITWNSEGETAEEAATFKTIKVTVVDSSGESVTDPSTGEAKEASVIWDAEVGIGYIGPCEARLTTVDANSETVYIYTSLVRAIAQARTSGDTVTLMMGVEPASTVVMEGKDLVLNLGGYDIAATDARALWVKSGTVAIAGKGAITATKSGGNTTFASSSSVIRVGDSAANSAKASVTIGKDVTVSSDHCYGVTVFGTNAAGIELVVNGKVAVTGENAAISGNGTSTLAPVSITVNNGATVTAASDCAIYFPGPGGSTLNIAGGTISGPTGVEIRAGTLNVTDGTITETASALAVAANGNGATVTGAAVAISQHTTEQAITVNISGGTLDATKGGVALYETDTVTTGTLSGDVAATVTGGRFLGAVETVNDKVTIPATVIVEGKEVPNPARFKEEKRTEGVPEGYVLVVDPLSNGELYMVYRAISITSAIDGTIGISTAVPHGEEQTVVYERKLGNGDYAEVANAVISAGDLPESGAYQTYAFKAVVKEGGKVVAEYDIQNTVGILHVVDTQTNVTTIISVPWYPLGERITVDSIVYLGNRDAGDTITAYDGTSYWTWVLQEDSTTKALSWQPAYKMATGSNDQVEISQSASAFVLQRGQGLFLTRTDAEKPIYLVGRADRTEKADTDLAGGGSAESPVWTLVGAPVPTAYDLNGKGSVFNSDFASDAIVFQTTGAGIKVPYTYKAGKDGGWGRPVSTKLTTEFGTFYITEWSNVNATIPAGVGFWYLNHGDAKSVKW